MAVKMIKQILFVVKKRGQRRYEQIIKEFNAHKNRYYQRIGAFVEKTVQEKDEVNEEFQRNIDRIKYNAILYEVSRCLMFVCVIMMILGYLIYLIVQECFHIYLNQPDCVWFISEMESHLSRIVLINLALIFIRVLVFCYEMKKKINHIYELEVLIKDEIAFRFQGSKDDKATSFL